MTDLEIPYVPRDMIERYIADHFYDEEGCVCTPVYEVFLSRIDCPNFNDRDAAICFLLGWSVEDTSAALRGIDDEDRRDAEVVWRSERHYFDDQMNA